MTIEELREGDRAAYWLLTRIYRSLNFPSLPLEQSLGESVSKNILINAAGWIGLHRPEPTPGRIFNTQKIESLRRRWPSAIPAE